MRTHYILSFLILIFFTCCSLPKTFVESEQPSAPDYSQEKYWSALPFREDAADIVPADEIKVSDVLKEVDVFYVYPTVYKKKKAWTADVDNEKLNKKIDNLPVKYQATVFNQSARVYAPRYRQANIDAYPDTTVLTSKVFDFAYADVKRAFEYYLENYNENRPIIIASHSQGTTHTLRLLEEYFDTTALKEKLVCAYIVGMATDSNRYENLKPCEFAEETNCYVTWSSYKMDYELKPEKDASKTLVGNVCVNPISWEINNKVDTTNGSILLKFDRNRPFQSIAQIQGNHLEVETNTILFKRTKELHLLDYNLFWYDIRENVNARVAAYLKE